MYLVLFNVLYLYNKIKQIEIMTLNNVTIGDKFIHPNDIKSKRISTVIDFSEKKSIISGKIIEILCIAEKDFMGQKLISECSPTTVLRNKI